ncbi:MAG: N-formylglutamate amidohydrolase [Spirochaetales bacterium]|nr:N-formylglutamate amidohydrolase [Spirochaetales bacterium]
MKRLFVNLICSCEHGGNRVPFRFRKLFKGRRELLKSHRGYDLGVAPVYRRMTRRFGCSGVSSSMTRLLIDQNRTEGNSSLFPALAGPLEPSDRAWLLRKHRSYVAALDSRIQAALSRGPVLHVSFHSFTPVFEGRRRELDFGILFDPSSIQEQNAADALYEAVSPCSELTVRYNEPYLGTDDGMCTLFRSRYARRGYAGLELEFNQGGIFPVVNSRARKLIEAVEAWLAAMTEHSC